MSKHIMVLGGLLLATALVGLATPVAAQDAEPMPGPEELLEEARKEAIRVSQEVITLVDETTTPGAGDDAAPPAEGGGAEAPAAPSLTQGLIAAMTSPGGIAALVGLSLASAIGGGLVLATRYVDPKVALDNPQRAMLYGFIKGNPGVNLKQLSEDFEMKTSTVLWHIRKLEGAELVRSTKANGLRVFYPVEGGIEAKRLGAAVAALSNDNASRILDYVTASPGVAQKGLVKHLGINPGTIRWHLRKLKEMGLMAELSQGRSSTYYPTELGIKALKQTLGVSHDVTPENVLPTPAAAAT